MIDKSIEEKSVEDKSKEEKSIEDKQGSKVFMNNCNFVCPMLVIAISASSASYLRVMPGGKGI